VLDVFADNFHLQVDQIYETRNIYDECQQRTTEASTEG